MKPAQINKVGTMRLASSKLLNASITFRSSSPKFKGDFPRPNQFPRQGIGPNSRLPGIGLLGLLAPELADFARENKEWLRIYRLPAYAPDMNPAEGIWSLTKRAIANFAAADLDGLVRIIKRKLKKIQYRPHLIDGCLTGTGLTIEPW